MTPPGNGTQMHVVGMPGAANEDEKTIVTGDGVKRVIVTKGGYGFATGDEPAPALSVAEFLEKQNLAALSGTDARTKETVVKALEELVRKGAVLAPALFGLPEGEGVEIKVTKKVER